MAAVVEKGVDDMVPIPRADLYALLDSLNSMRTSLMAVWDPDATIHPLSDAKRQSASRALLNSIVDIRNWLERDTSSGEAREGQNGNTLNCEQIE